MAEGLERIIGVAEQIGGRLESLSLGHMHTGPETARPQISVSQRLCSASRLTAAAL